MLHGWLRRPHVAEWWGEAESIDALREDFIADTAPRATRAFVAMQGERPIGFVQCYCVQGAGDGWWEDETDPGARGIDQFLAEEADLGRGLGRVLVRAFVDRLFADDPGVTVVQTDPDPANVRAVRCCTAAGFVAVGEVTTPDGVALLMKRWRAPAGGAG